MAFLSHGIGALRPLTKRAVASEIGLHESTVGRLINAGSAATPHGTPCGGNRVEGGAVDAGAEAAPGTAYLATGGSADPCAGEQKLNLGRPLATLAPGSDEPPALPADPTTVFTTACPISPPKSPFALSRTRD